jgi:hypothetical protein
MSVVRAERPAFDNTCHAQCSEHSYKQWLTIPVDNIVLLVMTFLHRLLNCLQLEGAKTIEIQTVITDVVPDPRDILNSCMLTLLQR